MPRPRNEGMVKVRDKVVLGKIKFDVAKNVWVQQPPEL